MKNQNGFTVAEMMAMVCIIVILVAVMLPSGFSWKKSYMFNSAARTLSHGALTARMQAIENKDIQQLVTMDGDAGNVNGPDGTEYKVFQFSTKPLSTDPAVLRAAKHRFRPRVPEYPGTPIDDPGDSVMLVGLDMDSHLNGVETWIHKVVDDWTFQVVGPRESKTLDSSKSITIPTVRNVTSAGRFRIVPVKIKDSGTLDVSNENDFLRGSLLDSKGYTLVQQGSLVTFYYDPEKFDFCFDDVDCEHPLKPGGSVYGAVPPKPKPYAFAEIRFNSRGLPTDFSPHTLTLREITKLGKDAARKVNYTVTAVGRISGGFDSAR